MAKKFDTINWLTPWFTARIFRNSLQVPDTEGQYADNKFKVDAMWDGSALDEVQQTLKEAGEKFWPGKEVVSPLKVYYANKEDKKAEKNALGTGLTMKSKNRPKIEDSKKHPIPQSVKIGSGSVLRAACVIAPYTKTEKVRENGKLVDMEIFGLTVYVNAVQVKKLVEGGGFGADAFDEVDGDDGFTFEADGNSGSPFGEATDL